MNDQLQIILNQIKELEEDFLTLLYDQGSQDFFNIKGKKIEFDRLVREKHKQLKTSWAQWLSTMQLRNIISAPFIYSLIIPVLLLDIFLIVYQSICFRLYGISLVKRSDYVLFDRHLLAYLNVIEKINCLYCSYANGIFCFAREIGARTEQYWCPIKHAHKMSDTHHRYIQFLNYGDADDFEKKYAQLRQEIQR